jgi:hypothetical protein
MGELVEVVAADSPEHFRKAPIDFTGMIQRQPPHHAITPGFEAVARAPGIEVRRRDRPETRDRAVRQHHFLLEHVINRLAVENRARTARVIAHHAAHGGAARCGNIRCEPQVVGLQLRVQLVEHDSGLDAGPALFDIQFEDAVEVLRGIDDNPCADRLSALRRATATHRDRTPVRGADAHDLDEILARTRKDDALGIDVIDAGVG